MSDLTILQTGEVVERAPLAAQDCGHFACPYCFATYPAMRVTLRGRMALDQAIECGLAIPICNECDGVWANQPAEVKPALGGVVVTGRVERGAVVVGQAVQSVSARG